MLRVDHSLFPDPFSPLSARWQVPDELAHSSQRRQRQLRGEILAATRRAMAESGPERLTLKRIAQECDVAVQTLRNCFGRREDLIVSAVNEHTSIIWQRLAETSSGPTAWTSHR